ncbi:MAG: orotidine-5'-phosphate decarboxylase [Candidatus Altiarchaeales archaeon]|nr:MAG: orotidine-5'-phosphate decarboxylase [Candidatus Altiarchaeales archaeon]
MFLDIYQKIRDEKDSILCIGLDPPPEEFSEKEPEDILNFCLKIVEDTSEYACAYKPNTQFLLFPLNLKHLRELNSKIHKEKSVSILDHKLSDIGSSNKSAIFWINKAKFDAFTFSPFSGNVRETIEIAHKYNLGVFVLTLMSNFESRWIQKDANLNGRPLFKEIAIRAENAQADGLVMGATDNVDEDDIRDVRKIVDNEVILLFPGIGAQGGNIPKIMKNSGNNILINVSRAIILDNDPKNKAREFYEIIGRYKRRYSTI